MWDYVDNELKEYEKIYNKNNRRTLDEFQNIFDTDKDLDDYVTKSDLNRLEREIEDNYEYLSDYGKYEARKRLNRRRMRYSDWFWFYLFMIYSVQSYQLAKAEQTIFNNVVKETYNREFKDLSKVIKPKKMNITGLTDKLLKQPNSKGYVWSEYKDAITLYNTNELHSLMIQNKRANKPLNVDNRTFKKLFDKQKHRMINVKNGKTSGAMDNELIYLANETKIQTYIFNDIEKCRFIAIHDKATTRMCESLDGQVFNVHDWNKFGRYSNIAQGYRTYNVYGLIPGVNLPPIDDNFHYCRSTIIYQLDREIENAVRNRLEKTEKLAKGYEITDGFTPKIKERIRKQAEILYEEFPEAFKQEYKWKISPAKRLDKEFGETQRGGSSYINQKFLDDPKLFEKVYQEEVRKGGHEKVPRGQELEGTIVHEFGHYYQDMLYERSGLQDKMTKTEFAKKMKDNINNAYIAKYGKEGMNISSYGNKKDWERDWFAEMFLKYYYFPKNRYAKFFYDNAVKLK